MLFTSGSFLLFFFAVYFIYLFLSFRWQNRWLLVASYFFYGVWDYRFLGLLIFSSLMDFFVVQRVQQERRWLAVGLGVHLLVLAFFKYFNFFTDSFVALAGLLGFELNAPALQIILPVGLSFYTFQAMSYLIDVARGSLRPTTNLLDYLLYVAFFPQLVAGPIERGKDLMQQFEKPRVIDSTMIKHGLWLILWGCFKKVYVADNLFPYTYWSVETLNATRGSEFWVSGIAVAFRFYCDFSGYTDMARGLAKLMGFNLQRNFTYPYFSKNPAELWRRWHITLSSWFREYVYEPIWQRGNHKAVALILTFSLVGLWHGADIKFLIWGFVWGVVLVLQRALQSYWPQWQGFSNLQSGVGIVLTFALWIFINSIFVSHSPSEAWSIMKLLLHDWHAPLRSLYDLTTVLFYVGWVVVVDLFCYRSSQEFYFADLKWPWVCLFYGILLFLLLGGSAGQTNDFIYFQF